jgi:hypothetical protein
LTLDCIIVFINPKWTIIVYKAYEGQLPDHPNHPKGRNSYAHVAICIRSKFKKSYKEIEDEKLQEVIEYIEHLKNNPS